MATKPKKKINVISWLWSITQKTEYQIYTGGLNNEYNQVSFKAITTSGGGWTKIKEGQIEKTTAAPSYQSFSDMTITAVYKHLWDYSLPKLGLITTKA